MFDSHNHNLCPAKMCVMFVTAAFMGVKLQFTKPIFSVSIICIDAYTTTASH